VKALREHHSRKSCTDLITGDLQTGDQRGRPGEVSAAKCGSQLCIHHQMSLRIFAVNRKSAHQEKSSHSN
jgi:hypothetical protein